MGVHLFVVRGDPLGINPHERRQIHLVYGHHIRLGEHLGVFSDHIVALGHGDHHQVQIRSQGEVRGTHEVSHVFDEKDVHLIEGKVLQGVAHLVGIQVALVAGVDLQGWEPRGPEALVIVVAGHIASDGPYFEAPLPELLGHADDELGFSRADGPHHVHRPDPPLLQKLVVLGGKLQLLLYNIAERAGDIVHGPQSYAQPIPRAMAMGSS